MNDNWYYYAKGTYSKSWIEVNALRDYLINHGKAVGYYEKMPDYPQNVGVNGTLIQYRKDGKWLHYAIVRGVVGNKIFVAEHSGPHGDQSYVIHGTDLKDKRTFWVGKG